MESADTFTLLPLTLDPLTKAISAAPPHTTPALATELSILNALHRSLIKDLEPAPVPPGQPSQPTNGVPGPPAPVHPKRSQQIAKLRDSAVAAQKRGAHADAIKLLGLALDMAAQRPVWEAAGLVREELSALYVARAGARMGMLDWAAAAVDAECSVELKKVGNAGAWILRGVCLREMGRRAEAREWVREGVEFESVGQDKGGVEELVRLGTSLDEE